MRPCVVVSERSRKSNPVPRVVPLVTPTAAALGLLPNARGAHVTERDGPRHLDPLVWSRHLRVHLL